MSIGLVLIAAASGFASTAIAYREIAQQRGFPYGTLHANGKAQLIGWISLLAVVVKCIVNFVNNSSPWASIGWAIGGAFLGVALISAILRGWAGAASILAAPVFAALMFIIG